MLKLALVLSLIAVSALADSTPQQERDDLLAAAQQVQTITAAALAITVARQTQMLAAHMQAHQ